MLAVETFWVNLMLHNPTGDRALHLVRLFNGIKRHASPRGQECLESHQAQLIQRLKEKRGLSARLPRCQCPYTCPKHECQIFYRSTLILCGLKSRLDHDHRPRCSLVTISSSRRRIHSLLNYTQRNPVATAPDEGGWRSLP